ncbi:hypothetical protein MG293_002320 [Ovis ammon polii]|uniref:Uncharacterized protein n=1 Tax=Ovis ammon polii TaxID=230172 RepID=A0AAD4UL98_OVIAM|nr:hypothetical protein MG293_002320 [Ovis ammon polii]KAI4576029.1 hypothetical protein MJT46_001864 [Ovis ammon polii x Ovis aries]
MQLLKALWALAGAALCCFLVLLIHAQFLKEDPEGRGDRSPTMGVLLQAQAARRGPGVCSDRQGCDPTWALRAHQECGVESGDRVPAQTLTLQLTERLHPGLGKAASRASGHDGAEK